MIDKLKSWDCYYDGADLSTVKVEEIVRTKCDQCHEFKPESALTKCGSCTNRTCEECGRTKTSGAGSYGNRREVWECGDCEFGDGGPPE